MKTGYTIGDAMTFSPVTVSPEITLVECAKTMEKNHVGAILVLKAGKLVGIVTEKDIVRKVVAKGVNPLTKKVEEVMETNLATVSPDLDIFDALKKMGDLNIRHLPVVKDGKLVGLITGKDILKIEPQLFEVISEKIELREEERKLVTLGKDKESICANCGAITRTVFESDEGLVCRKCLNKTR